MAPRPTRLVVLGLLLFAGSAGAASRFSVAQQRPYDLQAVPGATAARWASFGHPTLVANLWWLRAVQYMGDDRADERGWDKLFPAVDLVTSLDPHHGYAYQVAGIMLGGVGRVDESNALLEKGHRNVPDRYALPFQRAVNAFLYEGDYVAAGRWFEAASRIPGPHVARMRGYAAAMLVKGNAYDQARAVLSESLEGTEDDDTRRQVEQQLQQVELERAADAVERAVAAYVARHGSPPLTLDLLVFEGLLPSLPADPFGGQLYLDAEGRVRSTVHARRYDRPLTSAERERRIDAAREHMREMEKTVR